MRQGNNSNKDFFIIIVFRWIKVVADDLSVLLKGYFALLADRVELLAVH
jgi:hypothetical protein